MLTPRIDPTATMIWDRHHIATGIATMGCPWREPDHDKPFSPTFTANRVNPVDSFNGHTVAGFQWLAHAANPNTVQPT